MSVRRPDLAWPALAGLLGGGVTLYLFYPGFLYSDSTEQLRQAVTGEVGNAHPPIMVYLWMATNRVVFGPGGMLAVHTATWWLGTTLVACALARSAAARLLLVVALGVFPPAFGLLPTVLKDVGALVSLWAAAGLLLHSRAGRRGRLLPAALGFAFYGAAVRTNAFPAVVPLLWLASLEIRDAIGERWPRRSGRRVAGLVLVALVALFAAGVTALSSIGVRREGYHVVVPLWDLARISVATGELLVPEHALARPERGLRGLERVERFRGRKLHYDLSGLSSAKANAILAAWLDAIRRHPRTWWQHRSGVTKQLLTRPRMKLYHHQKSTPRYSLRRAGIRFERRPGYLPVRNALRSLRRSLLYEPRAYLALGLAALLASFASRSREARQARWIAASGLLYVAPLPLIAPATDFRYLIWLFPSVLLAATLLASYLARRGRRPGGAIRASRMSGSSSGPARRKR